MIRDVLHGERCPHCGAGVLGAESERVAVFEQLAMCEHRFWWRLNLWLIRCGLCSFLWPVVAQAQQVSQDDVLAAVRG